MDHYDVLGISSDAGSGEIRRAYLAAARISHPDFHDEDAVDRAAAEHRMRELNQAWECLCDPTRRAQYDMSRLGSSRSDPPTSSSTDPDPAEWRPYDRSPDPGFDETHDRPITTGGLPGWLRLAPVLAFVGGVVCIILGGFIGILPIVAVGLFLLLASVALFVVAPLVALTSSNRGTRLDESRW